VFAGETAAGSGGHRRATAGNGGSALRISLTMCTDTVCCVCCVYMCASPGSYVFLEIMCEPLYGYTSFLDRFPRTHRDTHMEHDTTRLVALPELALGDRSSHGSGPAADGGAGAAAGCLLCK